MIYDEYIQQKRPSTVVSFEWPKGSLCGFIRWEPPSLGGKHVIINKWSQDDQVLTFLWQKDGLKVSQRWRLTDCSAAKPVRRFVLGTSLTGPHESFTLQTKLHFLTEKITFFIVGEGSSDPLTSCCFMHLSKLILYLDDRGLIFRSQSVHSLYSVVGAWRGGPIWLPVTLTQYSHSLLSNQNRKNPHQSFAKCKTVDSPRTHVSAGLAENALLCWRDIYIGITPARSCFCCCYDSTVMVKETINKLNYISKRIMPLVSFVLSRWPATVWYVGVLSTPHRGRGTRG